MAMLPKPQFISATAHILPNILRPIVASGPRVIVPDKIFRSVSKSNFLAPLSLPTGPASVTNSLAGSTQVRCAHTDVSFPNLDKYRRGSNKDATKLDDSSAVNHKLFTYMMVGAGGVAGGYTGKTIVTKIVTSMSTSLDVLALAKIEVDLSEIPMGKNMAFKWRGKPLYVRHRTAEETGHAKETNLAELRDPQHDDDRTLNEEWLVILAICTHLGCVPVSGQGDYAELGGYYCPCHGSHYDSSGRIRKGPAPLNMQVPFYTIEGDTLVVG